MDLKKIGWYPISFLGGLLVALYSLLPLYLVYVDLLGFLTVSTRTVAMAGMLVVTALAETARRKKIQLFARSRPKTKDGFTLIELLVVISLIGILAALISPSFIAARNAAYYARTQAEAKQLMTALELYTNANGGAYPPDADRNIPPGLQDYLAGNHWPQAPWPGSIYDWDAWAPADLAYAPKEQVYQLSIRFCPLGAPTMCQFPQESWAAGFDYYSSVYFCVQGPCRAHASQPITHPAYCLNCGN